MYSKLHSSIPLLRQTFHKDSTKPRVRQRHTRTTEKNWYTCVFFPGRYFVLALARPQWECRKSSRVVGGWDREVGGLMTTPRYPPSKLGWKPAKSLRHLYDAQSYG
ncbi:hypothetical protein TNCV_2792871 [Trichonephila clavipes]|nr:hypothetical protein TNCV_2792871 [Trichonephila clavipes]